MVKNQPANARDVSLVSGSGRCPGEEKGDPLQYSYLGNPMDRGAWQATVQGIAKSQTYLVTEYEHNVFQMLKADKIYDQK